MSKQWTHTPTCITLGLLLYIAQLTSYNDQQLDTIICIIVIYVIFK